MELMPSQSYTPRTASQNCQIDNIIVRRRKVLFIIVLKDRH